MKSIRKLLKHLMSYYNQDIAGKTIAVWGLAFKPYTDDIREAPALENINELLAKGAKVRAYDPEAAKNVAKIYGDQVYFAKDLYDTVRGADALFVMTEWPEFRTPDFDKIANLINTRLILDGRNLFEPEQMEELGFEYFSVGRRFVVKK